MPLATLLNSYNILSEIIVLCLKLIAIILIGAFEQHLYQSFLQRWWKNQAISNQFGAFEQYIFQNFHQSWWNNQTIWSDLEHLSRSYFKISITMVKWSKDLKRFGAFEQHLFQKFLQPWWNNQSISNKFGAFEQVIFQNFHQSWWYYQTIWSDLDHLSRSYFKISINYSEIIKQFEAIWSIWAAPISKFSSTMVK